jgi:purine-binding chemotaxis protein CheW
MERRSLQVFRDLSGTEIHPGPFRRQWQLQFDMTNETYVLFELAGSSYALRSTEVNHIEMLEHITPVPNTAASVEGVVFSRGQVIPAMNLRVRFGFARAPHTLRTRIIIAQSQERTVALIVDAAREFRSLPNEAIRPIEETLTGIDGNYLRGVATVNERLVLLLNLEAVLKAVPAGFEAASDLQQRSNPERSFVPQT